MTSLPIKPLSRRCLLATAAAAASACAVAPAEARCNYAPSAPGGDPQGKFDGRGNVRFWTGNTVICPLPVESGSFAGMLEVNRQVMRSFRDYIAATPPASFHMTIYGGADPERRVSGCWPTGVSRHTPMQQVTDILRRRLQAHRFSYPDPIRVKVDTSSDFPGLCAIPVVPVNAQERSALYALRGEIAQVAELIAPDITTFRFHITFGYQFRPMPPAIGQQFRKASLSWRRMVAERTQVLALHAPVFCSLDDMFEFHPLLTLPRKA